MYNNFDMTKFIEDINRAEKKEKEKKPLTEKQVFFVRDQKKRLIKKNKKKR